MIEATLPVNHKAYVRKDQKKLILAFEGGLRDIVDETDEKRVVGLHDIREDYLEEHSLDDRALFRSMRRAFSSIYRVSVERRYDPEDTKLTDETIEQLKALGYLD